MGEHVEKVDGKLTDDGVKIEIYSGRMVEGKLR